MIATNPINIDGQTYTHYNISLAINGKYNEDDVFNAMVAATLTPVRFEDGVVIECEGHEHKRTITIGSTLQANPQTQQSVTAIKAVVQQFILHNNI